MISARDIVWLLATAIGIYFCGRVWVESVKDLQWIRASGQNGRLYRDGVFALTQVSTYVLMQIIGFVGGVARLFFPASPSTGARAWVAVIIVISWTTLLSINAHRELNRRRSLLAEINGRNSGKVKTRRSDE